MVSEMIDRVAKALEAVIWEYKDSSVSFQSHQLARAAIEAMREPTPEMTQAMEPWTRVSGHQKMVWQAGIDTALSG